MSPFIERFPGVSGSETLVLHIQENGLPLPPGEYGFFEWYCTEEGCDCRRALLQVCSPQRPGRILATINYGWESAAFYTRWMHGDEEAGRDITSACLDPLNPQSELADALLDGFRDYVRRDSFYPDQLRRHYHLFKYVQPGESTPASAQPAFSSMTITEILQQLSRVPDQADFIPYEAALRAAAQQSEAITPELIAALDRVSADPAHYLKNHEECLHLFAIYLLCQFRERRALDAFLRFFALPGEQALDLTGDMVTEHGAAVLASVCGGDPAPLLRLAHDESVNQFVRQQAIDALVVQSLWSERPREAVREDLRRLFTTLPKPGNAYVWAALVGASCDLQAPELVPEIRQAFAADLVDESVMGGAEDVEKELAQPAQWRLDDFRERHAPIDAVAEASCWLCFRSEEDEDAPRDDDALNADLDWDAPNSPTGLSHRKIASGEQPYIAPPKVGRNDPCPCGSGRKFKKCCGK